MAEPGDYLLVKTHHFSSRLIRFGQRSYGPELKQWNHVALVVENDEIVEALTKGVVLSPISKYPASDVRLVHTLLPSAGNDLLRANAVAFARSCVGERYGWVTILSIALKVLFKGRWNFGISGTSICSGLVARSLEREGCNFNPYDPAQLTPAFLASI